MYLEIWVIDNLHAITCITNNVNVKTTDNEEAKLKVDSIFPLFVFLQGRSTGRYSSPLCEPGTCWRVSMWPEP